MAVCRVEKDKNFTVMANYHIKDKSLSLKSVDPLSKVLRLSSFKGMVSKASDVQKLYIGRTPAILFAAIKNIPATSQAVRKCCTLSRF